MTWREMSAKQLNALKESLIIDVRSPSEHAAEHIPDSMNIPLLSDSERAEVGTVYVQESEVLARRLALKIISPKIPGIVDEVVAVRKHGQAVVIHCWRGGLRSEAVASFLSVVGVDCFRLTGGYKAWRNQVIEDLEKGEWAFTPIALQGLTGVGKTEILSELEKLGASVLDLEQLANHRGSVFGGMGLSDQPTQKNFEAAIWQKLRCFGKGPLFLEAEGRKIGKLAMPKRLLEAINGAQHILVEGSLTARKERIASDYAGKLGEIDREKALSALSGLKERLGGKAVSEIADMFAAGHLDNVIERLLNEYYDPLYIRHISKSKPFCLVVSGDDPAVAARSIKKNFPQQGEGEGLIVVD